MTPQERSGILQSIGKFVKAQFRVFERRLEVAEQNATKALSLDIDARIKLAVIEATKSVSDAMREDLESAKKSALDAAAHASSLRQPEDGKNISVEDVYKMVESVVAELPRPKDGKDADPDLIKQMVDAAVSDIPAPKDGKDADMDQVRLMVSDAVKEIEIPTPANGKDADPHVIREMIVEAIADLPKPIDGKDADPELVKTMVDDAVKSITIPEPKVGEDGRDALQIEILPIIDPDKSYPRGSYAKHLGGLWRAYEQTHELRGWECLVEGISDLRIDQVDERTFEAVSYLSSGKEVRKSISIPVVIDQGVFKSEIEYKSGDGVTWGGSYWIAQKDTPVGKPGENGSEGWRLSVKRGRDGKDGRNGIDKTAPVRVEK